MAHPAANYLQTSSEKQAFFTEKMVEVGNMHNPGDLDMMTSLDERAQLADALAAGVLRFLAGEEPG